MSTTEIAFALILLFCALSQCQVANLSFQILDEGESIEIPL